MDWPTALKQTIERNDPSTIVVMPSYGYFSARRFALPRLHHKPLVWFQDAYSQAVACYPDAEISFVGHSNGTYLAAESLKKIPSMTFLRMFLGGCVLPTNFSWQQVSAQTGVIVNAFCHSDQIVALLCNALRGVGRSDLGTAGFESFQALTSHQYVVEKGHGAAFDSPRDIQEVAAFILRGDIPARVATAPPVNLRRLSRAAYFAWMPFVALLAALAVGGFFTPLHWVGLVAVAIIISAVLLFWEIL
jgi:hypothetical protein